MISNFKDHFSENSDNYQKYRPHYPDALFKYLASITPSKNLVWDCACGTGQAAVGLAKVFNTVIASDASQSQIENAIRKENIFYTVEIAEQSCLKKNTLDLITVSQALHWFKTDTFFAECNRLLKPNGILAVWTYNLVRVSPQINTVIDSFYNDIIGTYWPPERNLVESGYRNIQFPFKSISPPLFELSALWDLNEFAGFVSTWSAVKKFQSAKGFSPVKELTQKILPLWGDKNLKLQITWPLTLILQKNC